MSYLNLTGLAIEMMKGDTMKRVDPNIHAADLAANLFVLIGLLGGIMYLVMT